MALTHEDLLALSEMMDSKIKAITDNMATKDDIKEVKDDIKEVKERLSNVEQRVTDLQLTLENETNQNIKLLAENHSNLIDKLNQAIRVSDKTTIYEIQVNILTNRVDKLEKELAELKSKPA